MRMEMSQRTLGPGYLSCMQCIWSHVFTCAMALVKNGKVGARCGSQAVVLKVRSCWPFLRVKVLIKSSGQAGRQEPGLKGWCTAFLLEL